MGRLETASVTAEDSESTGASEVREIASGIGASTGLVGSIKVDVSAGGESTAAASVTTGSCTGMSESTLGGADVVVFDDDHQ